MNVGSIFMSMLFVKSNKKNYKCKEKGVEGNGNKMFNVASEFSTFSCVYNVEFVDGEAI